MIGQIILKRKPKYPFITKEVTRHGRTVYYFRKDNGRRIRIPGDYDSTEFKSAYDLAISEKTIPPELSPKAVFDRNYKRSVGLAVDEAIKRALARSVKFGREFTLTYEWAIQEIEAQEFKCALTGIPFYMKAGGEWGRHPYAPSIDRIDPLKGYTEANSRVVVVAMNIALADWGELIFKRIAKGYLDEKKRLRRNLIPAPQN